MIVEFDPTKVGLARGSSHAISGKSEQGGFWRVTLSPGLNELTESQINQLTSFPGIGIYESKGAIVFRDEAKTAFSRTHELEALYTDQGYTPISKLAASYGIAKPSTGWKDAIPLIVRYEEELAATEPDPEDVI